MQHSELITITITNKKEYFVTIFRASLLSALKPHLPSEAHKKASELQLPQTTLHHFFAFLQLVQVTPEEPGCLDLRVS